MERLFVDTSAWFAFANRVDPDHEPVAQAFATFRGRLLTSNFVFDETVTLCLHRLGHKAAVAVGGTLRQAAHVDLVRVDAQDEAVAWDLFGKRRDKRYSFTDCTSFVLMRRLGLQTVAALDDDFEQEGFRRIPAPN